MMNDDISQKKAEIPFPCEWTIKAMGFDENNFSDHVCQLVEGIVGQEKWTLDHSKKSRSGKYLSVNVKAHVVSREQLETVYQALKDSQRVVYLL